MEAKGSIYLILRFVDKRTQCFEAKMIFNNISPKLTDICSKKSAMRAGSRYSISG